MENTSNQNTTQNSSQNNNNTNQRNNQTGSQNKGGYNQPSKHTPHSTQEPVGEQGRNWLKVIGAIVALLIIIALVRNSRGNQTAVAPENAEVGTEDMVPGCSTGDKFNEIDGSPCPVEESTIKETSNTSETTTSDTASYEAVIQQYAGKMVLLSDMCKAAPSIVTLTAPDRVLIANNSVQTVAVSLNGKKVTLTPYHYATAPVSTVGSYPVTCNGADVATVVLQ